MPSVALPCLRRRLREESSFTWPTQHTGCADRDKEIRSQPGLPSRAWPQSPPLIAPRLFSHLPHLTALPEARRCFSQTRWGRGHAQDPYSRRSCRQDWFCPFREEQPSMVYPDQEEVHKALPLFLPSGDTGGRGDGVMKLNPPPTSRRTYQLVVATQMGRGQKTQFQGLPSHPPSSLMPPLSRPLSQEQGPCLEGKL